jgi:hypothetical protein
VNAVCPICREHEFARGIQGWQNHINGWEHRGNWQPELTDPEAREARFRADFPEFFQDALTPSRRTAQPRHTEVRARAGQPLGAEERLLERKVQPCGRCGASLLFPDGFSREAVLERRATAIIAGRQPCEVCGS